MSHRVAIQSCASPRASWWAKRIVVLLVNGLVGAGALALTNAAFAVGAGAAQDSSSICKPTFEVRKAISSDPDLSQRAPLVRPSDQAEKVFFYGAPDQTMVALVAIKSDRDCKGSLRVDFVGERSRSTLHADVRYLLKWYRHGKAWQSIQLGEGAQFVPELIVKDPGFVSNDHRQRVSRLRVVNHTRERYVTPAELGQWGDVVADGRVEFRESRVVLDDSETLRPVALKAGDESYLWVEIRSASDASPGLHVGHLSFVGPQGEQAQMPIEVRVAPFDLMPTSKMFAAYYRGKLVEGEARISSEWKTAHQMRADMALMAEHGIRHPTIYQSHRQSHRITEVLSIRQAGGVSNDTIFYLGANLGPAFLRADLASVKVAVEATLPLFRAVGSESVFYYGVDEGDPKALEVQQPGWSLVREIGAGVFVAGRYEYLREHYAPKSVFVIAYAPRADASRAAHAHGARVLAYSTPQTGVANPLLFRRNYGLRLWQAKYDGFMLYAYQHAFGSSWDDSDGKYRDHLLAYPTTSGAIPALALKGVREGIYDLLYLETLEKTANAIRSQCSTDLVVLRALSFLGALRNDQDRGKDLDKLRADVARILEELATAERACRSGVVTGSESQWALGGVQG